MLSYTYIKLFIYILAGFLGFINIAMLFFLAKHKDCGNRKLYQATRNFTFSALLLVVMYFFFLFIRFVFGTLDNNAVLRILDIVAFLGLKYFWLKMIVEIIVVNNAALKKLIDIVFLIFTVMSVINFGFLMDSQYYIEDMVLRIYVSTVSVLLFVITLAINLYILIKYYHGILSKLDKRFIIINTILIHTNACWNALMAIELYFGEMILSTWKTPITDPTSFFLLLINLNTLIFIYCRDFSPLFKLPFELQAYSPKEDLTDQAVLDILAVKYSLTEREREVMILIYQGFTNPEIAERLFISKNTVRNHIHNIYYKLDISSRMELVYLVNSKK